MKEISEKSVAMYGVVPASKIIGETVVNRQGENVGKIIELVIDAKKNRVLYAVTSPPGSRRADDSGGGCFTATGSVCGTATGGGTGVSIRKRGDQILTF